MTRSKDGFPVFSVLYNLIAIPYNFLIGFVVGVAAPIAAIAGIVAGIRLLTNKVPFLNQIGDADGDTMLTLKLVPVDQALDLYTEEKDRLFDELSDFQAEIKAIINEARAQGAAEVVVEIPVDTGDES
jgi:hypothetical protein